MAPPKPCVKVGVKPGQEECSPADGPETRTGEHAAHGAAEGQKERHLPSTSPGTLGRRSC